jgi:hypothetical protein
MHPLTVFPAHLTELSVHQLAQLPAHQLQEADANLDALVLWARQTRSKLDTALEQRFGPQGRSTLLSSGRDFGTAHFQDGALRIKFDLPKKISWDQPLLKEIAQRISAAGEAPESYLDIKLSVPESRYANWPPALQQQFAPARTLEPGKPSFALTLDAPQEVL